MGKIIAGAVAFVVLFIGVVLFFASMTTIDAGRVGVISVFGEVQKEVLPEGLHFINPLAEVIQFDGRQKTLKDSMPVPTQDQLSTKIDISIQYQLIKEMASKMYKETGSPQEVLNVHMGPFIRSRLREMGKSVTKAEDFYQQEVQQRIQTELQSSLAEALAPKGIRVQQLLIRSIDLPDIIEKAVQRKKEMAQQAEAEKEALKKFMVEQERKEKQAEAEKKAELIQAKKKEEVMLIEANARLKSAEIDAKATLVQAQAEAEAKKKQVAVLGVEGYLRLKAMEELSELADGNHLFVMDPEGSPLPFLNMTEVIKK
jgi:regulator of protease activity HflC (stomatin/prohibitin superfamily)